MSDSFVVVQMLPTENPATTPAGSTDEEPPAVGAHPVLARRGFEIVDRRHNREVYLDGAWADLFARQIEAWKQQSPSPSQEEVEEALEGYAALAQTPVALH